MNKLILLLCFLPGLLLAQQGTISGTVVDDETAETMIALPVIVVGTDIVRTTDFDGKYSIQVPAGTYTIKFAYLGYQDKFVTDALVTDGEVTFLGITMVCASTGLEAIVAKNVRSGQRPPLPRARDQRRRRLGQPFT